MFPAGEAAVLNDSFSALTPEKLFYRNQLKVKWSPLCKEFFCFIFFTVPVLPIQESDGMTAVESRAVGENLLLWRAVGAALIYNTSQHPSLLLLSHFLPPLHFTFMSLQAAPTPNAAEGEV